MTQVWEVHAELFVLKNTKNICCPSFASPARMFGAAFFASGRGEAGQETNFQGRLWVGQNLLIQGKKNVNQIEN